MKIGITGWYGWQNLGDEMLLNSALTFFGKNKSVVFAVNDMAARNVEEMHGVETAKIKEILDYDLDCLIFAGGDVFHDLVVEWYFPKKLVNKIKCPLMMLSVGVPFGEGYTFLSKAIDWFVKRLSFISFRDGYSKKIFSDLWPKKRSFLLPDLNFLIEKQRLKRETKRVALQYVEIPESYFNITPPDFNALTRNVFATLYRNFRKLGFDPRFLVFNPKEIKSLRKSLPEGCEKVICYSDTSTAVREIVSSSLMIGQRLHSCVMALTQYTPFTAYRYQGKMDGVIGMIAKNRVVYPRGSLTFEDLYPKEFSSDERLEVDTIKSYLKDSLEKIRRSIGDPNNLENLVLPIFPFEEKISEQYKFSKIKHRPKPLRDLWLWIRSRTR